MIEDVKARNTVDLLRKANVVGVAIGEKERGGMGTGEAAITILVEKKQPLYQLKPHDVVPRAIESVPTDVIEVGKLEAPPPIPPRISTAQSIYQERRRPAQPGGSIGHYAVTAGTFGCMVKRDDRLFILSNNHVLANSNNAEPDDIVIQPGRYDDGTKEDVIAFLSEYVQISFAEVGATCAAARFVEWMLNRAAGLLGSTHRVETRRLQETLNLVDAALAEPVTTTIVSPLILNDVGVPVGVRKAVLDMEVQKCGRTTGHTFGRVSQIDATVQVSYGYGKTALFSDQLIVTADKGQFSAGGDSGSAVLTDDKHVVGLLFAGSNTVTICNPIQRVLEALQVTLVT